jgi:hypothetical protein
MLRLCAAALLCGLAIACTAGFALAASPSPSGGVQPGLVGPSPAPDSSAASPSTGSQSNPSSATNSQPSPPPQAGPSPSPRQGEGWDSLVPAPNINPNNDPKLRFEKYPLLTYTPLNINPGGEAQDQGLLNPATYSQVAMNIAFDQGASGVTGLMVGMGALTVRIIQWAFNMHISDPMGQALDSVVAGMREPIYRPLVYVVIVASGLWFIWQAWARRHTRAFGGLAWMLIALTFSSIFVWQPRQTMSTLDYFTADLSKTLLGTVAQFEPAQNREGQNPGSPTDFDAQTDFELRLFSDRYWTTFVFEPWCAVMFGQTDQTGQKLGNDYLQANASGQLDSFNNNEMKQQSSSLKAWWPPCRCCSTCWSRWP